MEIIKLLNLQELGLGHQEDRVGRGVFGTTFQNAKYNNGNNHSQSVPKGGTETGFVHVAGSTIRFASTNLTSDTVQEILVRSGHIVYTENGPRVAKK